MVTVAKLVNAQGRGPCVRKDLWVQLPPATQDKGLLVKWYHATLSRWNQEIDTPTDRHLIRSNYELDKK
jgi:hypothetical protein